MHIGINALALSDKNVGTQWYTYYLIKTLLAIDTENTYTIFLPQAYDSRCLEHSGNAKFYYLTMGHGPYSRIFLEQCRLSSLIEKLNIDIFHAPSFFIPVIVSCKCKTVVTIHDMRWKTFPHMDSRLRMFYYRFAFPQTIRLVDSIVVNSFFTEQELINYFPEVKKKITVTPIACNFEEGIIEESEEYSLPKKYFLFVGKITPNKNIERILSAFSTFTEKTKHYKLAIVGPQNSLPEDLENFSKKLGIEQDVYCYNYLSKSMLMKMYQNACALVFPSLYEGFGIPILEAMTMGTPVITSDRGAMQEVASDAGMLVDPYDKDSIARAMDTVVYDSVVRNDLIKKGTERVKAFSWGRTAQKTLDVYKSMQ